MSGPLRADAPGALPAPPAGPEPARPDVAARPAQPAAPAGRLPAWSAPVGVAVVAACGCAVVAAADPATEGFYPPCPFRTLTGWWCPGCGSGRALHRLLTGEIGAAFALNPLAVLAAPLLVYAWVAWLARTTGTRRLPSLGRIPAGVLIVVGAVVAVYSVARNLPWEPFASWAPR